MEHDIYKGYFILKTQISSKKIEYKYFILKNITLYASMLLQYNRANVSTKNTTMYDHKYIVISRNIKITIVH